MMQLSTQSLVHVTGLSLAPGGTYGVAVVAKNSIGESSTFVHAFSVPCKYMGGEGGGGVTLCICISTQCIGVLNSGCPLSDGTTVACC